MGKNQSASNLTNIIKQDANGNISFVSGSTTLMSVSSSGAIETTGNVAGTASYASNAELFDGLDSTVFATTGSNTFAGIQTVNSNLIVTGSITAQTLVVQTITSSVDFVTGSTRFGSLSSDTHVFTGSVNITGSTNLAGSLTVNKVAINSGNLNLASFPSLDLIVSGGIGFSSGGSGAAALVNRDGSGNTTFYGSTGDIKFSDVTLTSNYLTIKSAGNVGIGTTSPVARLNVFGTSGNPSMTADTNNLFSITGNLGPQLNVGGYNGASYGMWLQVKDANNTNINYPILLQPLGGAVGIGTASPSDTLFISRNAADNSGGLTLYNANTSGYGSALTFRVNYAGVYNTSRIHGDWDTGNAGALHFYTANTSQTLVERMLITGGGNIGIGVTPSAWGSPFVVIQGGSFGQSLGFQTNAPDVKLGSNHYYNGSSYIYTTSNGAAMLNVAGNSGFQFNIAPSGTAGNAITFNTALVIPLGGSVYINNATTSNFINLESLLGNAGSAIISIAQTDSNKLAKATIIVQRSAYSSGITYTVATLAAQPIANYLTFGISGTYLTINTTGGAGTMAYNALVIPAY
jgi:hypothetical protein